MPTQIRPIDHVVLAARDLAKLTEFYERLGFLVGARNKHPWGTQNHIVQFAGSFLELISTGPGFVRPTNLAPHSMSFPAFIHDYLQRREGPAMLALASEDATADRESFIKAAIGNFETFHFARRGRRPDGSDTEVAFTLAFARSNLMAGTGFFTCQHHHPDNFWTAELQDHPNSAVAIEGVVMVAENPAAHAEFLSHVTGQREMSSTSMGLELAIGRQKLDVLTPVAFAFRYGEAIDPADGEPRIAAVRIRVLNPDMIRAFLTAAGVEPIEKPGALIVPAAQAFGTVLVFETN